MDNCSIIFDNFQQSNVGSRGVNGLPPDNSPSTTTNKAAKKGKEEQNLTNKFYEVRACCDRGVALFSCPEQLLL